MSHWEAPGETDEWFTPRKVFDALGCVFDLDVAAPEAGGDCVPCRARLTSGALDAPWHGLVWMNPPFGRRNGIEPWLDRFFAHGNGIALAPDRTSAPWFQRQWGKADIALFTFQKLKFVRPDGSEGVSPSSGTVLFGSGAQAVAAIANASSRGLGILASPIGRRA